MLATPGGRTMHPGRLIMFVAACQVLPRTVVLNWSSIEPQGFGESVSGVQRQEILSNKSKKNKIYDTHFIFPTTKGLMNACMELVGFSTSNKVKSHCSKAIPRLVPPTLTQPGPATQAATEFFVTQFSIAHCVHFSINLVSFRP